MNPMRRLSSIVYPLVAMLVLLSCLAAIRPILSLAPELSDASFYILNLRHPDQIDSQLSMFGTVWFSLFGQTSLIAMRTIHVGVLLGSGALLAWRYCLPQLHAERSVCFALGCLAGCSFLTTFIWVLIEPSYNSLVLIWLALTLVFAFPFLQEPSVKTRLPTLGAGVGFGAAIFFLALTKITAAAAAAVFFLVVYGVVHAGRLRVQNTRSAQIKAFSALLFSTLVGCAIGIAFLWVRGFSPGLLWARFEAGRLASEQLGAHSIGLELITVKAQIYFTFLFQALQANWSTIGLIAILSLNAALSSRLRFRGAVNRVSVFFGMLLAILGLLALHKSISANSALAHFQLAAVLRWCALLMAGYLIWTCTPEKRTPLYVLLAAAALGPFMLVVGTTNSWGAQFSLYSGLAITVLCVALAQCSEDLRIRFLPAFVTLLACLFFATHQYMQNYAYRQGASLDQAQIAISYGPERAALRTTPVLARAYEPLDHAREIFEREDRAPVLLDVTGRAPGVAAYLNATLPRNAWILSGYPGSNDVFADALDQLDTATLRTAWLLIPISSDSGVATLDTSILQARLSEIGRSLEDYERIADIDIVYVDIKASLLRPKVP